MAPHDANFADPVEGLAGVAIVLAIPATKECIDVDVGVADQAVVLIG